MDNNVSRWLACAGIALLLVPILTACSVTLQGNAATTTPITTATSSAAAPAPDAPGGPAASNDKVVKWINATAHPLETTDPAAPLDDLAPLENIVGQAEVVGLGEATHGSSEIWTIKQRMVRYLVEHMGFTGFVLEVDWPIGQQLDAYTLNGAGDPHTILASFPWNSQEVVSLFEWLRAYNADPQHPHKVRVSGMDVGSEMARPTTATFGSVTDYVQTNAPDLLPQVQQSYSALVAAPFELSSYTALPQPTKEQYAAQAQQVVELLQQHEAAMVERSSRAAFAWALQHAQVIRHFAQMQALFGTDPGAAFTYHDQAMAENAGWWHDRYGKTIIWAHNGHVAKHTMLAQVYPDKVMGTFLRARFGDRYLSIGTSFGQGGYLAMKGQPSKGSAESEAIGAITLGPPTPDSSNAVLDRADRDRYLLDLRPAPAPIRTWLQEPHPFRVGTAAAVDDPTWLAANTYGKGALGQWFDVLLQLRQVSSGHMPQN